MTKQLTSTEALHAAYDQCSKSPESRRIYNAFLAAAGSLRLNSAILDGTGEYESAAFLRGEAERIEREGALRIAAAGRASLEEADTQLLERPGR